MGFRARRALWQEWQLQVATSTMRLLGLWVEARNRDIPQGELWEPKASRYDTPLTLHPRQGNASQMIMVPNASPHAPMMTGCVRQSHEKTKRRPSDPSNRQPPYLKKWLPQLQDAEEAPEKMICALTCQPSTAGCRGGPCKGNSSSAGPVISCHPRRR